MKRLIAPIILLAMLLYSTTYGADESRAPDGFFGTQFGSAQKEVLQANKDMNPTPTKHPFSVVQAFDLKTEASGKNVVIQLDFFEKKFISGLAVVENITEDEAVKYVETLVTKYGNYDKVKPDNKEHSVRIVWYFNKTVMSATYYSNTKNFYVNINDKKAAMQVIEAEKKKNPKFKPEKKMPNFDHSKDITL